MRNETNKLRLKKMVELSGEGKKILNMGDSNNSELTRLLKKNNHAVKTIDIDKRYNGKADYYLDLEKDKLPKGPYDIVVAGEVLEHIYNLKSLLKKINKILKKKGELIISVPNIFNLFDRFKFLMGKLPRHYAYADKHEDYETRGHIRNFNVEEVRWYLEKAGFKITAITNNGAWYREKRKILGPRICPNQLANNLIIKAEKLGK